MIHKQGRMEAETRMHQKTKQDRWNLKTRMHQKTKHDRMESENQNISENEIRQDKNRKHQKTECG